jgi:DNA-binding NtrC family response regulator
METLTTRAVDRDEVIVRVLRTCLIEIVAGPDAGRREKLDRPIYRVGTQASNDLVLGDETVSKQHLEIAVVPDGYRITDLDSSNGTFAGTLRLGELTVIEPVTLQLGQTTLRLSPTDEEAEVPASQHTEFGGVRGKSPVMRELFEQLEAVAQSDCSVLLEGETGVGKEHIAEALHQQSPRARGPFVVVDCGALVGELMQAELFGYVRGAFSGADRSREGLIESANGGTLLLDEVGELSPALQTKLLGTVERRKVVPLGSNTPRSIDVRIIAATNRNLGREVNQGRFRSDLFYRLAVVRMRVPSLRERREDIPLLVQGFLDQLRTRYGERVPESLSAVVMAKLAGHDWPGNVRELRNAVERAALKVKQAEDTPEPAEPAAPSAPPDEFFLRRADALEGFEKRYFGELLAQSGGNLSLAARLAGLDRRYLHRILKRVGLLRQ